MGNTPSAEKIISRAEAMGDKVSLPIMVLDPTPEGTPKPAKKNKGKNVANQGKMVETFATKPFKPSFNYKAHHININDSILDSARIAYATFSQTITPVIKK